MKNIELDININNCKNNSTVFNTEDWIEYTDEVKKALEKQLLKKPIEHSELPDGEFSYLCPTCNRLYWEWSFISHYCSSCGQRLKLN